MLITTNKNIKKMFMNIFIDIKKNYNDFILNHIVIEINENK